MKALVTGGAGFIGSHIAQALLEAGARVRLLDNLSSGRQENIDACAGAEFIRGDITSEVDCRRACEGCETVYHHAALVSVQESIAHPDKSFEVNVRGTLNVLLAAHRAGARRFILASSAAVYGDDPTLPKRESMPLSPISPYGADKAAAEQHVLMANRLWDLETVILRYFNVFGPRQDPNGDYAAVIPKFVFRLVRDEAPIIYGDGKQTRDFLFVADVVQANLNATESTQAPGGIFNVARGQQIDLRELLRLVEQATGRACEPRFEPARSGDIRHSAADVTRATQKLDFAPRVSLPDGLKLTAEYFRRPVRQPD